MRLEYISEQNIASNSRWKVNRIFLFTEGKSSFSGGKLRWEKGKEPQIIPWPSESVGGPPFVLRSLFLSLFLWKRGIKKKKKTLEEGRIGAQGKRSTLLPCALPAFFRQVTMGKLMASQMGPRETLANIVSRWRRAEQGGWHGAYQSTCRH